MNVLCMQCSEEFKSLQELQEHMKKDHISARRQEFKIPQDRPLPEVGKKEVEVPVKKETFTPPPDPIELSYIYHGQCPKCRTNVTTLNLNISGNEYRVAWCEGCKLQLEQKRVIPIDKMESFWVEDRAIKSEVEDDKFPINKFKNKK